MNSSITALDSAAGLDLELFVIQVLPKQIRIALTSQRDPLAAL